MSGSGKTEVVKRILQERHNLFSMPIEKIVFVYNVWQKLYDDLKDDDDIIFTKDDNIVDDYAGKRLIVVYDDLMLDFMMKPQSLQKKFLVDSHHKGQFIIFIVQALFFHNARLLHLNCKYYVLLRFLKDKGMLRRFFAQYDSSLTDALYTVYQECTHKNRFGHFLLSLHPLEDDRVRFRSSVFPTKDLIIYQPHGAVYPEASK